MLKDFLCSLRQQKESEIWAYQQNFNGKEPKNAEQVRVDMAVAISQRNMLAMLENLPVAVAAMEQVFEAQKKQAVAFAEAQKG